MRAQVIGMPAAALLVIAGVALTFIMPASAEEGEAESDRIFAEGVDLDVTYKADVMSNLSGGIKRGTGTVSNLDVQLTFDGEKLFGLQGTSFFLNGVSSLGGKPNATYTGSFQGINNNEVTTNTAKLYQAWVQQTLWDERVSLLAGLLDLGTEFYVNDTAGLFMHPGSSVGLELGQTGVNGPSISPTSSVAFRAKVQPVPDWYAQAAVFDGVPGDPNNPRGTHVQFNQGDGALVIAEIGYLGGDHGQVFLSDRDREEKASQPLSKYAIGTWYYTASFDDRVDVDGAGNRIRRKNNQGIYVLAERTLYQESGDSAQGLNAFIRYGIANDDINRLDRALAVGAAYTGLLPGREADQLGFSVSNAHNGEKYKRSQVNEGTPADSSETGLELTYRTQATPWLAIQPSLQYVINPNTNPQRGNATVLGVRFEFALSR